MSRNQPCSCRKHDSCMQTRILLPTMTNKTFRCTRCKQERPVCEAQIRVKTTKDGAAGEASKMCKRCAESKKLATQRKRLAYHLDEEEEYDDLGSFPSLARWRKALDDKVATAFFKCNARSGYLINPFSLAKRWR